MNVDPREDLPRISVDTYPDWKRIEGNYKRAAIETFEAQTTENGLANERDAMLYHLNKFIETTFAIAQPNLRVNGRPFEELDVDEEEMEPFDEALDRSVWILSDQRLKSDLGIAEKRREKPRQIESAFRDHLRNLESLDAKATTKLTNDDLPVEPNHPLDLQEHEQTFQQLSAIAKELHQSMPVQHERSTTVKTVATEVKSLRS